MWVHKEPKEIRIYRRNKWFNLKMPFTVGFFVFVMGAILLKLGYRKYQFPMFNPIPRDFFFTKGIEVALIVAAICFLLVYIWQLIFNLPAPQTHVFFCLKCEKIRSSEDDSRSCDCGGEFVNLADVKWVKDGHENSNSQHG
jgi:hypothetical protein